MDKRRWLLLLLGLALLRGLLYASIIPPWQSPDETGHFEYAWLMAHNGRLPSPDDLSPAFEGELLASLYEWRYGDYTGRPLPQIMPTRIADLPVGIYAARSRTVLAERFSLAYLWQALLLLPVRGQELAFQLLVARFSSVLLNLGIVWLAFRTFSEMMPARTKIAAATALVIVLMPQHTFINSTAGDGPLAEFMACAVLYAWVRLFRKGADIAGVVAIASGTLFAVLSKSTAAYLILLDLGLAFWWLLRQPTQRWSRRRIAYLGIAALTVGLGAWASTGSTVGVALASIPQRLSSAGWMMEDARGTTFGQALLASHDSFWAYFGWMAVPVSLRWYGALLLLSAAAVAGWVIRRDDEPVRPSWAPGMMGAAFLSALAVFVWAMLLAPGSDYYQYQGRYLFTAVIPLAYLLTGGWLRLLPERRQNWVFAGGLFLAVFDAWSLIGYVIPYFYYR